MKCLILLYYVALYVVTLYTRVWIEIATSWASMHQTHVTLYTRVWIEIDDIKAMQELAERHPLHEGVD